MSQARLRSFIRLLGNIACRREGGGLSDADLLERFVGARDEAAFETLVWRYSGMILGLCRRVLGREEDAEDAFQTTFLIFARKAHSVGKRESVGSWLHRVAYRVALSARARASRRTSVEKPESDVVAVAPTPDPGEAVLGRELEAALDAEVNELPSRYRVPIVLHYLEGRSYEEIADHLGCTRGTVGTKLARGRDLLRRRLTQRGLALPAAVGAVVLFRGVTSAAPAPALVQTTLGVALGDAGPGTPAALLAQGVLQAMRITQLKWIAVAVLSIAVIGVGAGLFATRAMADKPAAAQADKQPDAAKEPKPAEPDPATAKADLMQLARAMHAYVDVHGRFPPAAVTDKDGKPLLSWRVLLLPYLDQKELYKEFKLDEPWDSAHNRKLLGKVPAVFLPVRGAGGAADSTFFQVFTGKATMFDGREGVRIEDITDGTVCTVMITEAAEPVAWTRPADLEYDADKPLPKLGGLFKAGFHIALADGSVRFVKKDFLEKALHAAITRNGSELVDLDDLGK
jgi:RNA polymerase sigma factor (sigma-70 family)